MNVRQYERGIKTKFFQFPPWGPIFNNIPLCQISKIMNDCPGWDSVKISDKTSGRKLNLNINWNTQSPTHNVLKHTRRKCGQLIIQTIETPSFSTLIIYRDTQFLKDFGGPVTWLLRQSTRALYVIEINIFKKYIFFKIIEPKIVLPYLNCVYNLVHTYYS